MDMEKGGLETCWKIVFFRVASEAYEGRNESEKVISDEEGSDARGRSAELLDSRQKFGNTESA